jgi:hypothetical protein
MPPPELVAWTEYVVLLAGAIAAVRALDQAQRLLRYRADQIKGPDTKAGH